MINLKAPLFTAQAISSTTAYTSSSVDIRNCSGYSITVTTTGTATGTAKLQASNDNSTWIDLPNSGATANIAVSGANSQINNVSGAYYSHVRLVYTNATNSGTLTAVLTAKGGV